MSWSVIRLGKPKAVQVKLAQDFANIKCSEPEETIKNTVASAVNIALTVFPPNIVVKVEASGSQYAPDPKKPDEMQNTLTVKLEPLYGFTE